MAKEEAIKVTGQVVELLPNATFRVQLENNNTHIVIAYLGGKLRKHVINIGLGDKVDLEMSAYDLTKARIVYRNR